MSIEREAEVARANSVIADLKKSGIDLSGYEEWFAENTHLPKISGADKFPDIPDGNFAINDDGLWDIIGGIGSVGVSQHHETIDVTMFGGQHQSIAGIQKTTINMTVHGIIDPRYVGRGIEFAFQIEGRKCMGRGLIDPQHIEATSQALETRIEIHVQGDLKVSE